MNKYNQWSPSLRYLVFGLSFLALALALWTIRSVLEPLIVAAFIAYLINPAVNFLTSRTRMKRPGAVALVYFITLAVLIGLPATLTPIFFDELKQVVTDILDLFDTLVTWLMLPHPIPGLPLDFNQIANNLLEFRSTFLSTLPEEVIQLLGKTSLGALWVVIIMVAVYYFLANWPRLRMGLIDSFPEEYRPELSELYQRVRQIWMNYLRGQLLLMLIVGVVFTIAWTVIGIPGALALGVAAGFLTLIPDVGPFIAAMLAVGVALLEGSSWIQLTNLWVAVITLIAYLVLIAIKNFWLRPFIVGRSVHMNEALVLITILLATILWGILGALLIVPLLASLVVIFDYLRRRVLGMPPFPPEERFVSDEVPISGSEKVKALKSRISRKKKA